MLAQGFDIIIIIILRQWLWMVPLAVVVHPILYVILLALRHPLEPREQPLAPPPIDEIWDYKRQVTADVVVALIAFAIEK